jgi:acyl carrier protein
MTIVFSKIKQILHESYSIQLDQIELETNFELELGTDSREFFELLSDLEYAFGIEINFDDVVKIVTIQDAVTYIEKRLSVSEKSKETLF